MNEINLVLTMDPAAQALYAALSTATMLTTGALITVLIDQMTSDRRTATIAAAASGPAILVWGLVVGYGLTLYFL